MNNSVAVIAALSSLVFVACGGGSANPTATPQPAVDASAAAASDARSTAIAIGEPTTIAETTTLARTVVAGGPTAIAQATSAAATSVAISSPVAAPTGSLVATLVPDPPRTATARAATIVAGGPTVIAEATVAARQPPTATPIPRLQLISAAFVSVDVGNSIDVDLRIEGAATAVGAFNFDIVYDQRLVTLDAPEAAVDAINTSAREFKCDLPPASGDVDSDPNVGRARLVCFSFGGPGAAAPVTPLTVARVKLHGMKAGNATLTVENLAVFTPDAKGVSIGASPMQIDVK